jgi:hypothetical protein
MANTTPLSPPGETTGWELVHQCEGTPWTLVGPLYSGGLGMLNSSWAQYDYEQFAPNAGEATPAQQIIVAENIEPTPPYDDTPAGGCHGW